MRRPVGALLLMVALLVPGAVGLPGTVGAQTPPASPAAPSSQAGDSILILDWVQERITDYVLAPYRGGTERARLVEEGRPEAIGALDFGGQALPGDNWITGHRIGIQVKIGALDRALDLARDCRASDWWCAALLGFVLHERGEIQASEEAYDLALSRMPEDVRCEWIAEIHWFERPLYDWNRHQECGRFAETSRILWWLSNPLFMEPGNDRKTEHFSRIVQSRFHYQTLDLHGRVCHPSHRWSLVAFGFPPTRWSYAAPFDTRYDAPGLRFVPRRALAADPFSSRGDDWNPEAGDPDERYDVPRWSVLHPLPGQVALFRREGGLQVAAASDLAGHPLAGAPGLRTALALSVGPDTPATVLPFPHPGAPGLFATDLPVVPLLLSMEAVGEGGEAGRTRWGHRPAAASSRGFALSDPLLFAWEEGVEETLEAVAPRMLGTTSVRPEAQLGVFWEIYGVDRDQEIALSVSAIPEGRGFFRRLGEAFRLLDRPSAMAFTWREAPGEDAIAGRALRLDLSSLDPGRYTFQVTARSADGDEVVASRSMEILG